MNETPRKVEPMNKRTLAACVAALSLGACEEPARPSAKAKVELHTQPLARAAMAPTPAPAPDAVPAVPTVPSDTASVEPVDPLSLAHDAPSVDHLARARALAGEGEIKGALLEARRALYSTPSDEETLVTVAKLARRAREHRLAEDAWGRVALLRQTDAAPLVQQGRARLAQKDFRGAIAAGREATARDEGDAEAYQVIGLGHLGLDQLAPAIASFEKVVELAPTHGWALNNLGFAYLRANEDVRALEALERAAALLPEVAVVQNNLGVALARVGADDAAQRAFRLAMDLSPRYIKAQVNAARIARAPAAPQSPLEAPESMSDIPADAHPMPLP